MSSRSALRTPYRSRVIVRSGTTGLMDERKLCRAIAVTQFALLSLCAARIWTDWLRGPLTVEGTMALALLVVLTISLVAKAIAWTIRAAVPAGRHPPSGQSYGERH
jgi:hypothetical protein